MLGLGWGIFRPQAVRWYKALNNSLYVFRVKTLLSAVFFLYMLAVFLCVLE